MMESLTSGTIAGAGSFRCQRCGYVLTLAAYDTLSDCPGCAGRSFVRASLFSTGRMQRVEDSASPHDDAQRAAWFEEVREHIAGLAETDDPSDAEGTREYVAYEESGELKVVALTREWTRVGRSLAADVRFDDPTVSRRHALIVRQPDGVRVLDDRSLNGVFVNGERIEWRVLHDGDEILVGRYRLGFFAVPAVPAETAGAERAPRATPLHPVG